MSKSKIAFAQAAQTIVAIPAKNEAERIAMSLNGLDRQTHCPDSVILLLNNCTDETEIIARQMAPALRYRLDVISRDLPPDQASAGHARRMAMAWAAEQASSDGILLTTDADAVVPIDWVAHNRAVLHAGIDVVCGRAVIDPVDVAKIPAHLHADDALECALIALLDDLAWMLDPEMHDPPFRHTEASGASLAVSVHAFHQVGGIPAIPSGEDRAFVRALWMIDARVRHDPAIRVTVSGRTDGRAQGGMAETIRRRMIRQDEFTDDQLEPALDAFRRYGLRNRARRAWRGSSDTTLATDLALPRTALTQILRHRFFGTAWAQLEAISPILQRRRLRFVELKTEIAIAQDLRGRLAKPETLAAD